MSRIKAFLLLPIIVAALAVSCFSQQDLYSLTVDSPQSNEIKIEAHLQLEDSLLYMSPNGPLPERWPQFIKNLKVEDSSGATMAVKTNTNNHWLIQNHIKHQRVKISYTMILDHPTMEWPGGIDGVAYREDWGIMSSGRALFVINGENKKNLKIAVQLPMEWKASTPWIEVEKEEIFQVRNQDELLESLIFLGTHREYIFDKGDFQLKFVLGGDEILKAKDDYFRLASDVLDYYMELMGGIPTGHPDQTLQIAMVIINQSNVLDGEVIGNHISMLMPKDPGPQEKIIGKFMFAHEFFHLWNGKTIRFQDTKSDWFKEGISNYYTIKALHKTGVIDESSLFMVLNNLFYNRYITDPGLNKIAPSDAAFGFDKDNHWGLIYGGGLFAGMSIDLIIRNETENRYSLDDIMRALYEEFGSKHATVSNAVLLDRMGKYNPERISEVTDNYIFGTATFLLQDYFKFAGIGITQDNTTLRLHHLPDKTNIQDQIWRGMLGVGATE